MLKPGLRRTLGILILIISLALLIWGLWPFGQATRVIYISPIEMQIPTPESFLIGLRWFI
jgi:hypothetical protein